MNEIANVQPWGVLVSDIDYAAIRARVEKGMTATEILDSIARRYPNSALIREVVVGDPDCDRFAAADEWAANGRQGKMPPFEPTFRRIDGLLIDMGQTRTAIEVKISRSDFLRETDAKRRVWRHQVLVALAYRLKRQTALAARPAAGEETR